LRPDLPGFPPNLPPGFQLPPGMSPLPGMPMPQGPPGAAFAPPPMPNQGGDIAGQMTRWAADAYDQARSVGVRPEIQELVEYFTIDDRAARALDMEMKKRQDTFDVDMQALWVGIEGARNPSGMLMLKVKEMMQGTFKGMTSLGAEAQEFGKKYKLDAQATVKLAEVMEKRENAKEDMEKLGKHLERSNKPSALLMMMLRQLREGKPIKEPEYAAAIGSKQHEKELDKTHRDKNPWNDKERKSRSRRREREKSRDRGRKDRDRDRDRDRDKDRKRSRSRRR